jgi:hypothetical protein
MPDDAADFSKFKRGRGSLLVSSYGGFTLGLETHTIAQLGYGMDGRAVPVQALQLMGTCPAVYLAERTLGAIVRRPDLYSVIHPDPTIRATVEAWLWPLLERLTASAVRGFSYGTVTDVLDWQRETIRVEVPTGGQDKTTGRKLRAKSMVDFTAFGGVHEVHPDETLLDLDAAGEPVRVHAGGTIYAYDRTAVWCWDPEFGSWVGQGARRRAWRDYCEWLIVTVLRDKYLERSVDAPRIAWVPDGEFTLADGTKIKHADHMANLLEDLRGSGNLALPGAVFGDGSTRKFDLKQLELADRHDTWDGALNRHEANMFTSYLVAPQLQGQGGEEASAGGGKVLDVNLRENVEALALFAASGLTRLVGIVHRANYDPAKVQAPTIGVTDVGKREARKLMQEVMRLANTSARGEIAMRTDMPALLDALGIPLREPPPDWELGETEGGDEAGRPAQPGGPRDERREDAATNDGEEDTGGEDQVREDEREEQAA